MTTFEINGKSYTTSDEAELTNRLFDGGFQSANQGEEYITEYSVDAEDEAGNECKIVWQFSDIKGAEKLAEDYSWDDESCMAVELV